MNLRQRKQMMIRSKRAKQKQEKDRGIWFKSKRQLNDKYMLTQLKGSSTYYAVNLQNGERIILKALTNPLQDREQLLHFLKSMMVLRQVKHSNILELRQIIQDEYNGGQIYFLFQNMPNSLSNINSFRSLLNYSSLKGIIFRVLLALNHLQHHQVMLHYLHYLHQRNILINEDLTKVKLDIFGILFNAQQNQRQNLAIYPLHRVVQKQIRPPQVIFSLQKTNKQCIWLIGRIFGEFMALIITHGRTQLFTRRPYLQPMKSKKQQQEDKAYSNDFPPQVSQQLFLIFQVIGAPEDADFITDQKVVTYIKSFPCYRRRSLRVLFEFADVPLEAEDFFQQCLQFDPRKRMTVLQAINHKIFDDIREDFLAQDNQQIQPIGRSLQKLKLEQLTITELRNMIQQECL